MTSSRTVRLVLLGSLFGVLLSIAPALSPTFLLPVDWNTEGLAQRHHEAAQAAEVAATEKATQDAAAALAAAATIADLTDGMDCWDPSTGQVGTQIVVRDSATDAVTVIPFDAAAYDRAVAGEFSTLLACA